MKVYCIDISNDTVDSFTCGIALSEEKAIQMIQKLKEIYGDIFEYEYYEINTDTLYINDEEIEF